MRKKIFSTHKEVKNKENVSCYYCQDNIIRRTDRSSNKQRE